MDERFIENMGLYARDIVPLVREKCQDPSHCKHPVHRRDKETGEWYHPMRVPKPLEEEELMPALLAKQIKLLTSIKNMLMFFVILTVVGIAVWLYIGTGVVRAFR